MSKIAIIGGQFGDEAKSRVGHLLSRRADYICRFGGSGNCGHTIYVDGKKYVHHLVPSVDFKYSQAKGFLGSGMVINLFDLRDELHKLEQDFPEVSRRIIVDPDAFVVTQAHIDEDKAKNGHIGSTNKGVGPAYAGKIARRGLRIKELLSKKNEYSEVLSDLDKMGVTFRHSISLANEFNKSRIIFEGAQSVMLDINHGTYPFVTSSDCTVSGIYSSGFNFIRIDRAIGVVKCYSTRVGNGPFPTELEGQEAEDLRAKGNEIGATTGRPRRVGWMDLPQLRYAVLKGGITELAITKLDILNGMKSIPVCSEYHDGAPMSGSDFFDRKPHYVNLPGWKDASSLDKNVMNFISYVENAVGVPVDFISTGVGPKDLHRL